MIFLLNRYNLVDSEFEMLVMTNGDVESFFRLFLIKLSKSNVAIETEMLNKS